MASCGWNEAAEERSHREAVERRGSEGERGEGGGPGQEEAEKSAEGPGKGWVEDEAGFAGVPCGVKGPEGAEDAVLPLGCGFEPADEVEDLVVTAAVAAEEQRQGDEQGCEQDPCGVSVAVDPPPSGFL